MELEEQQINETVTLITWRKTGDIVGSLSYSKSGNYVSLEVLQIRPAFQNHGLGSQLFQYFLNRMVETGGYTVVLHPLEQAIPFYTKMISKMSDKFGHRYEGPNYSPILYIFPRN